MTDHEVQSARGAVQAVMVADTGLSLADLSTVFVKSGFFKDVREQSQAIVKVLVGQELGLKPLQSMMGIHIVEGKPELSAGLLGMLVKRSGRYDYRVVEHTDTACELEFFTLANGTRESLGTSRFTMEDAARAGLAGRNVWKSYPRNMLHARALSNGVRWYAMDALGLPVYIEGEIETREAPTLTRASVTVKGVAMPEGPACPNCGLVGALLKKRDGTGIVCWVKRDGCGAVWPADTPFPPTLPPVAIESSGSEDCAEPGCWGGRGHPGAHVFDTDAEALKAYGEVAPIMTGPPPASARSAMLTTEEAAMTTFTIGKSIITTQGMTKEQFEESHRLATALDKRFGKATARGLLAEMLNLPVEEATRKMLTEAQAAEYLTRLEQALGAVAS